MDARHLHLSDGIAAQRSDRHGIGLNLDGLHRMRQRMNWRSHQRWQGCTGSAVVAPNLVADLTSVGYRGTRSFMHVQNQPSPLER